MSCRNLIKERFLARMFDLLEHFGKEYEICCQYIHKLRPVFSLVVHSCVGFSWQHENPIRRKVSNILESQCEVSIS